MFDLNRRNIHMTAVVKAGRISAAVGITAIGHSWHQNRLWRS